MVAEEEEKRRKRLWCCVVVVDSIDGLHEGLAIYCILVKFTDEKEVVTDGHTPIKRCEDASKKKI